jgi:hypothetical protein
VLAVLGGCGGGGKPSASTTRSPSASGSPAATPDPAVAVADRRKAIVAEVRALRALKPRQVTLLFYKLDGLALKLGSRHFQADSHMLRRMTAETTGFGPGFDALMQRIQRQEWATLVPVWKRYAGKLGRLRLRNPVARSARDFQLAEWRRSIAVMREFLGYLRREPPKATHDDYYQVRAYGQASRWPVVIAEPSNRRNALVRGLRRDLRRLQGVKELGPGSPSVGDVYRRRILRTFVSPLSKTKRRETILAAQLWMLFRIAELEKTPGDVYEDARRTIALQSRSDARDPFGNLRDIGLELIDHYIVDKRDLRTARHLRAWALKLLARPVPPVLEPTRKRMVAVFEDLDLSSPPRGDPLAIFDTSHAFERDGKRIKRILFKGAKLVDSPKKMRKAMIAAVLATRPSP